MKIIATLILFAGLGHGALAVDEPTPSPSSTPVYRNHLVHRGALRRVERVDRRRARQAEIETKAERRAQAKTNRRSTMAQAQSRAADRAREQAQRRIDAEARVKAAQATPHPASDLMKRMGFSDQEIATQKAREEIYQDSRNAGISTAGASPATETGTAAKPAPAASPPADPDSH